MVNLRIRAEHRLEARQVMTEIPLRLLEEQEETRIHLARSSGSRLTETHHGPIAAKDFLFANIRCGNIQPARLVFGKQIRSEPHAHRIHDSAFFHHEACHRPRLRMPFKTAQQVFGPGRVKFQVHVAKHLDLGIHIFEESIAGARITEIFRALDNFAVKIFFP